MSRRIPGPEPSPGGERATGGYASHIRGRNSVQRFILKSKIHRAKLTGTELDYEGSIAIDKTLLEAADILPGEQVHVLNLSSGCPACHVRHRGGGRLGDGHAQWSGRPDGRAGRPPGHSHLLRGVGRRGPGVSRQGRARDGPEPAAAILRASAQPWGLPHYQSSDRLTGADSSRAARRGLLRREWR